MENVCTVTQIRLGEGGGGGIPLGGGGSANREPGSYIYIYMPWLKALSRTWCQFYMLQSVEHGNSEARGSGASVQSDKGFSPSTALRSLIPVERADPDRG